MSVAPFGKPVVPLVYWMLIGSSNCNSPIAWRTSSAEAPPEAISSQPGVSKKVARSSTGSFGRTWSTIATKSDPFTCWAANNTRQPDCRSTYSSSLVRYEGLMLTRITPSLAVAYWTSAHSLRLGPQTPTRSPFFSPSASMPPARRSTASPNSAYV